MVPPFVGVAVKVTDVPVQIVVCVAAMLTEGVTDEVTVIVIALLTGLFDARQPALLVITTIKISLLANVVEVNVALLVPALTPFTFH